MERRYGQYCPLARALDRVGDRWTLLIVRELLIGRRRYSDLRDGLPGIATNLLAARLRELGAEGIVERTTLPPPAASTVYELTERGRALEEPLLSLIRWGGEWMGTRGPEDVFRPRWLVLALRALLPRKAAWTPRVVCELRVEDGVLHVALAGRRIDVAEGPADDPDLVVRAEASAVLALGARRLSLAEAVARGEAEVDGSPSAVRAFERVLAAA